MDMNNLKHLTGEDILYDPRSDTYKAIVGDKTVEVPSSSLRSERLNMLKDALRDTPYDIDAFRRDYLGDRTEAARAKTAIEAEEAARAGVIPMKTMVAPWDVYTHSTMGASVSVLKPEHPAIIVYSDKKTVKDQHDRYPSIPCRAIIEDAIELLNKNKKLCLHKISLNKFGSDYILTVSSRGHTALGKTPVRTVEMSIDPTVFDRMLKIGLDRDAGLGDSLDTNTYIKLRLAFLLYRALSLTDEEAKKFCVVGVFRVMFSNTQFDYSV